MPGAARFGYLTAAARAHRDGAAVETAHRHHETISVDRRGVGERVEPGTAPEFLARPGLVGGQPARPVDQELIPPLDLHDRGRGPRADELRVAAILARAFGRGGLLFSVTSLLVFLPGGFAGLF